MKQDWRVADHGSSSLSDANIHLCLGPSRSASSGMLVLWPQPLCSASPACPFCWPFPWAAHTGSLTSRWSSLDATLLHSKAPRRAASPHLPFPPTPTPTGPCPCHSKLSLTVSPPASTWPNLIPTSRYSAPHRCAPQPTTAALWKHLLPGFKDATISPRGT